MASARTKPRDLANALVAAGAQGIAGGSRFLPPESSKKCECGHPDGRANRPRPTGYVMECVHSTALGVDATFVFLMQLIDELDDALAQFLPASASPEQLAEPLAEADEVELGSLLSAASLVRPPPLLYLWKRTRNRCPDSDCGCHRTGGALRDREEGYAAAARALPRGLRVRALLPVLAAQVLLRPQGLVDHSGVDLGQVLTTRGLAQAVALMGSTRVLEAFGEHVAAEDVEKRLRWLFSLFLGDTTPATDAAQRLNCLLRPACEYVTVAMQSHPIARRTISNEILPLLMRLLIKEGDARDNETSTPATGSTATPGVAEAVKVELAATIVILLEVKFPQTPVNPFSLLKLPAFVEEMEPQDSSSAMGIGGLDDVESNAGDAQKNPDDSEEKSVVPLTLEQEIECTKVLSSWLRVPGRRLIAAQTLSVMYRVIMQTASRGEMVIGMPSGAFPMEDLVQK